MEAQMHDDTRGTSSELSPAQGAASQRELLEQIVRLRTLVDAAFEGIGISRQGIIVDVNEQLTLMLGYERTELIGMPVGKIVAPESRDLVRHAIESGRTDSYEHMAIRKDGTVFPVEVRGRMLGTGAEQVRLTAVRDITARRSDEAHLKTLTQRFKLATTAASIAIWDWDLATNEVIWDERMFEIYGLPFDPSGRMTFDRFAARVHPDDLAAQQEALQQTIRERGHGFREFRIVRPDGAQRHIQAADAVITNDNGAPVRMVGMNIDVTERKRAGEALQHNEELFRAIVGDQTEMIVRWKPDGTRTFVNKAYCRFFGQNFDETVGTSFFPLVAEKDRELIRQKISALTPEHPVATDVHRSLRPNGETSWQEWTDRGIFNAEGRLVELQSVGRDISERKNAEQALRESEERFRAVVESSPDCIVVAVDERVAYVNPAGANIFAISNWKEVIGRSVYDFVPLDLHEEVRARRQSVLERGMFAEIKDGRLLRMDGSSITIEAIAVPFVYSGQPAIMNLIRDISERKRIEEERAEALVREQSAREEFTRQLIASQEAERRRISAELHDSLGQNLLLIKNRVQLALTGVAAGTNAHAQLEGISALATASIGEVRQISHDLHPYQLDHLGLTGALEAMIDNIARSSGVTFERKLDQVDEVFDKDAATNLYRVVQESLNNVLKHSGAWHARVQLERDVREIILRVSDDGQGFDAAQPDTQGLGLRNITERVRMLGGTLVVNSGAERGTCLEVTIPIPGVE
jgi:PAS domain S-box-containing protein